MPDIIEIPFGEVLIGEGFISKNTKRCFKGLKIKQFVDIATIEFDGVLNAVILEDCNGIPVGDVGSLIFVKSDTLVEVDRTSVLEKEIPNILKIAQE